MYIPSNHGPWAVILSSFIRPQGAVPIDDCLVSQIRKTEQVLDFPLDTFPSLHDYLITTFPSFLAVTLFPAGSDILCGFSEYASGSWQDMKICQ